MLKLQKKTEDEIAMKQTDMKQKIETLKLSTINITDPQIKITFNGLLNLVEELYSENGQLTEENQKLKDENNRLKGEQGKPDIKKRNRNGSNSDHSSEKERKENNKDEEKKGRNREAKLPKIKIDREQVCPVDK